MAVYFDHNNGQSPGNAGRLFLIVPPGMNVLIDAQPDMSYSFWAAFQAKFDSVTQSVFGTDPSGGDVRRLEINTSVPHMRPRLETLITKTTHPIISLTPAAVWQHFVFTRDATNDEQKMYIDGVLVNTDTTVIGAQQQLGSVIFDIGSHAVPPAAHLFASMQGYFEDFAIVPFVMTLVDVKFLHDNRYRANLLRGSKIGYWPLDQIASVNTRIGGADDGLFDRSGNAFTLALSETDPNHYPWWSTSDRTANLHSEPRAGDIITMDLRGEGVGSL